MNGVVAGVAVVLILSAVGFFWYRKKPVRKYISERSGTDDRSKLLDQFKATQRLALHVYKELYVYVELNNAHNQFIRPGTTYHQALDQLRADQKELYSETVFKNLVKAEDIMPGFPALTKTLKDAFDLLSIMDNDIRLKASYTL